MILPLSLKDVIIAGTFVFMTNVGSFTTPYLMGGNSPKMLGIALFDQFNKYLAYNRSAALSVIMFLLCSVSAGVYIYTNLKEKDWEQLAFFIGGFKSPLYFFAGSQGNRQKIPERRRPRRLGRGIKTEVHAPGFYEPAPQVRFYARCGAGDEISVGNFGSGRCGFLGAGRFATFRRVFLWKTWPGGIGGTVKFFFASAYFCAIFRLWVVRRGGFDYN